LTNGTLLNKKGVRSELLQADVILPSLDAASNEVFEKIDRPSHNLTIQKHIQGLIDLRAEYKGKIWLEIFLLKDYNDTPEELLLIKQAVLKIKPDLIQLNTLDRPGTVDNIIPLSTNELQTVIDNWQLPNIEIIASPLERTNIESYKGNIEDAIIETIARRPCTLTDLQNLLGVHINEINKYLGALETKKAITRVKLERGVFYKIKQG